MGPDEAGVIRLLTCQWRVAEQRWESVGSSPGVAWSETCAPCHETGDEVGVGCEACHGAAADHASDPSIRLPFREAPASRLGASVCGSCHLQGGESPTQKPFPEGFEPGLDLAGTFYFDWDTVDDQPDADRHAQLELRDLLDAGRTDRSCLRCHEIHSLGASTHTTKPREVLCAQCHVEESFELKEGRETVCPVCTL